MNKFNKFNKFNKLTASYLKKLTEKNNKLERLSYEHRMIDRLYNSLLKNAKNGIDTLSMSLEKNTLGNEEFVNRIKNTLQKNGFECHIKEEKLEPYEDDEQTEIYRLYITWANN